MHLDSQTALLVIDMQKGFRNPAWGRRNNAGAEAHVGALLSAFRAARLPIVHVRHDSRSALGRFRPGLPENEPLPEAVELPLEPVVRKSVNSAFIGTDLEQVLRSRAVREVVVVGLTTNHCVSTTARMAANLGFETIVVADATATFEGISVDGGMRSADEVHAGALSDLNEEFARIVDTGYILAAVGGGGRVPSPGPAV